MNNIVITIGREYGSGGKYIGQKLADALNIPFYDKEIINKTYEKNECNYSKLEEYDEVKRNGIIKLLNLISTGSNEMAFNDDTYQTLISSTITSLADTGSCVILGRNSNKILKGRKNVINIFIYSNNLEFKIGRKMEIENISYEEAYSRLKEVDKMRKRYYESQDKSNSWGNARDYDYLIDSSILGIDGTVELIKDIYIKYSKKED